MGVPANTAVCGGKRSGIEETIRRFRRTFRRRLRKFARERPEYEDLVVAFPAVAFAIITEFATLGARKEALQRVRTGQGLKLVAKALGVPMWMRKLPPEAFAAPLPDVLPMDATFGAQIAGLIPDEPQVVAAWLSGVLTVYAFAGADAAHWVAKHPMIAPANGRLNGMQLFALYAWFSDRPAVGAGKLIERRFNAKMSPASVAQHLRTWADAISREVVLGDDGLADTWLAGGRAAGYRVVPLATMADLRREAEVMNNCVVDYVNELALDRCRLFSLRRGGQHVATIEVRPHPVHPGIPDIEQLRGPDNEDVPLRVWQAVFTWLGKQGAYDLPDGRGTSGAQPNPRTWAQLWQPLWRDGGAHPLVPEQPTRQALQAITAAYEAFAHQARV